MHDDSDATIPPDPPNADAGRVLPYQPKAEAPPPELRPCPWAKDADDFFLDPSTGLRACGARKQRGPGWCTKAPKKGAKRCYKHGGASLRGAASPRFTNGTRSKYMPIGVKKIYTDAKSDQQMFDLRNEAATHEARLAELFKQLGTGESGAAWEEMLELSAQLSGSSAELDAAVRSGDPAMFRSAADSIAAAARAIRGVIERGAGRDGVWEKIRTIQQDILRVAAAEWKRQVDLKTLLPADQAMNLVMAIMQSVKRNCRDVHAQEQIAYDIGNYINAVQQQDRPKGEVIIDG
jgi:transcription termination factor NusB